MTDYSQKEKAEEIIAAAEVVLNQAHTLGVEARQNNLGWNDNPFEWGSELKRTWHDGYSIEEENSKRLTKTS